MNTFRWKQNEKIMQKCRNYFYLLILEWMGKKVVIIISFKWKVDEYQNLMHHFLTTWIMKFYAIYQSAIERFHYQCKV